MAKHVDYMLTIGTGARAVELAVPETCVAGRLLARLAVLPDVPGPARLASEREVELRDVSRQIAAVGEDAAPDEVAPLFARRDVLEHLAELARIRARSGQRSEREVLADSLQAVTNKAAAVLQFYAQLASDRVAMNLSARQRAELIARREAELVELIGPGWRVALPEARPSEPFVPELSSLSGRAWVTGNGR